MSITSGAIEQGSPSRAVQPPRVGLAAVILVGAGVMIWGSRVLRSGELAIAGVVMSLGAGHTVVYQPGRIVFFETDGARTVGLQITASCTAIFLMVPFVVLAAFMVLLPRTRIDRVLLGMVVGGLVVFWLNQLRLLIIAWATRLFGVGEGFDWAHIMAGAIVTTLSMLIALFLFFWLSLSRDARLEGDREISAPRRRLR